MTAAKPSPDDFAQLVLRGLAQAGASELGYDPDDFTITYRTGGEELVLNIGPTYHKCGEGEDGVVETVRGLVETAMNLGEVPETWARAAPLLFPVLRSANYFQETGSLSRPALPHLREYVVVDTPRTVIFIGDNALENWGVDADTVFATARANLAQLRDPVEDLEFDGARWYVFDEAGGYFKTSWLLHDGWLARFAGTDSRPVILVPDVDTLVLATDIPELLPQPLEEAESTYREGRGISPQAYTVDDSGAVVPYPVTEGHPAARELHRAASILAIDSYGEQVDWLREKLMDELNDAFVASVMARQGPDGAIRTLAVWGEDLHTMLPRADEIAFAPEDPDGTSFTAAWDDVAELVDLRPVDGLDPPRYEVHRWPDRSVLTRLRFRSLHHAREVAR
ncbi:MAG: DUF1444 family protein [Micromonosporaceae bacterium]